MVVAVLASAGLAARADTTYTYTGNDFTTVEGPYTTSDSVSGSFTVASPLGDNLSNFGFLPTSFSFTDGVQTLTNSDASLGSFFYVWTGGSGNVTSWNFGIPGPDLSGGIFTAATPSHYRTDSGGFSDSGMGVNFYNPGTWSVQSSVTPEPGSWMLLGTGMLGLLGLGWKKVAA